MVVVHVYTKRSRVPPLPRKRQPVPACTELCPTKKCLPFELQQLLNTTPTFIGSISINQSISTREGANEKETLFIYKVYLNVSCYLLMPSGFLVDGVTDYAGGFICS